MASEKVPKVRSIGNSYLMCTVPGDTKLLFRARRAARAFLKALPTRRVPALLHEQSSPWGLAPIPPFNG